MRRVYIPFNLVCLFARTRKNVCKQKEGGEEKRRRKHTLDTKPTTRHVHDDKHNFLAWDCCGCWGWGTVNKTYFSIVFLILHVCRASLTPHSTAATNSLLETTRLRPHTLRIATNWSLRLFCTADGKGLKVALVSADIARVRRHVGLLWSRDALKAEVGEPARVVAGVNR